jgi:hypothetical protein
MECGSSAAGFATSLEPWPESGSRAPALHNITSLGGADNNIFVQDTLAIR